MPILKRNRTKYPGVYYITGASSTGKAERIYYIRYRKAGKLIEEKAGRQYQDDMTPARAARLRALKINQQELSNREKREILKTEGLAGDNRLTRQSEGTLRPWDGAGNPRADSRALSFDGRQYEDYLESLFRNKESIADFPVDEIEKWKSIAKLSSYLIAAGSLEEIFHVILDEAKRLTGSTLGWVVYKYPWTDYLVYPPFSGEILTGCRVKKKDRPFKEAQGLIELILGSNASIVANDFEKEYEGFGAPPEQFPIYRFLSSLTVTLNTITLQVIVANAQHNYNERYISSIELLAGLCAYAIAHKISRTNYREIFNAVNDTIIMHDVDEVGKILDVNDRFCEKFGYTVEQAKQLTVYDLSADLPPYTRDVMTNNLKRGGEAVSFAPTVNEWPCRDKEGNLFWIEVSLRKAVVGEKGCFLSIVRDITERREAQDALKEKTKLLDIKSKNLAEANAALRVLLKRREEDKYELEDKVMSNVKQLLVPYLNKLKHGQLDLNQRGFVDILESNLQHLISPFSVRLSSKSASLTPAQMQIADFVRSGRSNKEIAELLNLSINTIDTHRRHIRKKLGLTDKKTNLRTYLLSLQ